MSDHEKLEEELSDAISEYHTEKTRSIISEILADGGLEIDVDLSNFVTQNELKEAIDEAELNGGPIDLSNFVTQSDLEEAIDDALGSVDIDLSDYVTHNDLSDYVTSDELTTALDSIDMGGGVGGGDTGNWDDFESMAEELRTLIERGHKTLNEFEVVSGLRGETWNIGPSFTDVSADLMHNLATWGNLFTTARGMYVGDVEIFAGEPGTVTFGLYDFDGSGTPGPGRIGGAVDSNTVDLLTGINTVHLGLYAPPGEYLLTRPVPAARGDNYRPEFNVDWSSFHDSMYAPDDDEISLGAINYPPSDDDSMEGVTYHGKMSPLSNGSSTPRLMCMSNIEIYAGGSEQYYREIGRADMADMFGMAESSGMVSMIDRSA